jgi:hypothetical protein
MDIDKVTEKIEKIDGFLTTLTKTLKKHWKVLIIIFFGFFIYWSLNLEDDYIEDDYIEYDYIEYDQQEQHQDVYFTEQSNFTPNQKK